MKNFLYNKKIKICIRVFSAIGILVLFLAEMVILYRFLNSEEKNIDFENLETFISNFLVLGLFVFIIIFPQKFSFIALATFFYSISIIPFEPSNPMGILMFDLGIMILNVRGFFQTYFKTKILSILFLLMLLSCFRLRLGLNIFIEGFVEDLGYSFVFFLGIFFTYGYASRNASDEKILNIAKYEGLKESDIDLMYRVLNNLQYKVIAKELQKSEGTIRNRLNKIYDILGVADRVGFVTTFSGFELIYKPEIEVPETQVAENPDNF